MLRGWRIAAGRWWALLAGAFLDPFPHPSEIQKEPLYAALPHRTNPGAYLGTLPPCLDLRHPITAAAAMKQQERSELIQLVRRLAESYLATTPPPAHPPAQSYTITAICGAAYSIQRNEPQAT
jgi:hypothetical protein